MTVDEYFRLRLRLADESNRRIAEAEAKLGASLWCSHQIGRFKQHRE